MQLLIKAKLLDLKGYFERTHSLRKLLSELRDIEGVGEFLKNHRVVLRNLERAAGKVFPELRGICQGN